MAHVVIESSGLFGVVWAKLNGVDYAVVLGASGWAVYTCQDAVLVGRAGSLPAALDLIRAVRPVGGRHVAR